MTPLIQKIKSLHKGDYHVCENVFIVLFRDDWIYACWDEYADVEMMVGY
jgi:hypothetical protein